VRRRRIEVDAIDAHTTVGDHLAILELSDDPGGERLAARDDGVGILHPGHVRGVTVSNDGGDGDAERAQRLVLIRIVSLDHTTERGGDYFKGHSSMLT